MTLPPILLSVLSLVWTEAWTEASSSAWASGRGALAAALLANIWQSAAIALFLAALLRLAPRLPAPQQCRLWAGGIAAGAMLPLLSLLTFEQAHHTANRAQSVTQGAWATGGTPFHLPPTWSTAIVLAWLLACVGATIRLAAGMLAVVRLLRSAQPAPGELASDFPQVRLLMSPRIAAPVTTGLLRPTILLPAHLPQTLSRQQLEQVLLHELAHARRHDHQAHLLVRLLHCLLPLSPALAYMDRRLAAARELACDDAVLACSPAPKAYAACLVRVAECAQAHKGRMLAPGLLGRRSQLARRIAYILAPTGSGNHIRGSGLLTLATGAALAVLTAQLHAVPALISFDPVEALPAFAAKQAAIPPMPILSTGSARLQPVRLARHRRARVSPAPRFAALAPFSIPSSSPASSTYRWNRVPASAQLVVFWQQPAQSVSGTLVLLVSGPSHWLLYRTMPGGFLLPI